MRSSRTSPSAPPPTSPVILRSRCAPVRASSDLPSADAIYVNAAATHPLRAWLDALNPGGRLVFPLQAAGSTGAMALVTRPERGDAWPARLFWGVVFIPCEGAQDAEMGRKLDEAFRLRRSGEGALAALRGRAECRRTGSGATAGRCRPSRPGRALPGHEYNLRASSAQINPSESKPDQTKPSKIAWFYLVLFVRIGAFQWVTWNPNKKLTLRFRRASQVVRHTLRVCRVAPLARRRPCAGSIRSAEISITRSS